MELNKIPGRILASRVFLVLCGARTHALHPNVRKCTILGFTLAEIAYDFIEHSVLTRRFCAFRTVQKHSDERIAGTPEWLSIVGTAFS